MTIKPLFVLLLITISCGTAESGISEPTDHSETEVKDPKMDSSTTPISKIIRPAAARTDAYFNQLRGQRIGLLVNQTSTVGSTHLVDTLLAAGIKIQKIFAPEHGFRGTADAGEQVVDGKDPTTGIPVISLYGQKKKPGTAELGDLDLVVFDIQDVGARFYTYISTMHFVMEACAEQGKKFMVLDRPNPNGHYVDGPVLDPAFSSFVGMHPVPVVHGMTVGEYAQMINGQRWLAGGLTCDLEVITCEGYTHDHLYELPINPSPNLPNARSIYLYPSLCFFEGTTVSVGRGTTHQFQIYGHPDYSGGNYSYTPESMPGAKHPKHEGKTCYGYSLLEKNVEDLRSQGFNLNYLMEFYQFFAEKESFFLKNKFFDKLAGTDQLRRAILAGTAQSEIRKSWEPALSDYKQMRRQYLLYP